jgi:hypothetical protein
VVLHALNDIALLTVEMAPLELPLAVTTIFRCQSSSLKKYEAAIIDVKGWHCSTVQLHWSIFIILQGLLGYILITHGS